VFSIKSKSFSNKHLSSIALNLAEMVSRVGCESGIAATITTFCVLSLVLRCLMSALNSEMENWMITCLPTGRGKYLHEQYLCSQRLITLRFCYGKISEICVQLNKIFGIFFLLFLTYHNAYFHLDAFDTLRNIYNYVVYNISPGTGELIHNIWLFVDGTKIIIYFSTISLFASDCKRFKSILCIFINGLSTCNLRTSVNNIFQCYQYMCVKFLYFFSCIASHWK